MITCTNCGRTNEPHYKFCQGCGHELPSPRSMPTPTTRGWLDADDQLIETTNIGHPIDRIEVAPELPDAEAASASTRSCASCGAVVPMSFSFCGQCGGRMDAPIPTIRNVTSGGVTQGTLVLVRADGSEGGSQALLLGTTIIGRGRGPLFDGDGYLSPTHGELVLGPEGATIRDTDSLNGIFCRLVEEEELFDGDVFRIGQELLRFDLLPPPEPLADGTHIMGSPQANMWGRVVLVVAREQDGTAYPLSGESVIFGRERGDVLFAEDGYVSGTHARLSTRNGRHYLADLNSSNGTFIKIRGTRDVASGTLVLMGQQLFRIVY
ncbi:MAG: FHA domain-containing protein [Polyangia bacterium]